jgi:hypothetical protein
MTKADNRTSPGTLGLLAGTLFVLLLAYVLSAGPVARWWPCLDRRSQACLESFYSPLAWACAHSTTFGNVNKRYLDLWSRSNGKK